MTIPSTSTHTERATRTHDHLLVRVGPERFAIPLASVEEAIDEPAVVTLPGVGARCVGARCVGALRWRGRHVPLHDAGEVLGWPVATPVAVALVLVARDPIALAVDELLDVVGLPPEGVRPWAGRGDTHGVVGGVTRLGDSLVALVRPEAILLACGGGGSGARASGALAGAEGAGAQAEAIIATEVAA